MTAYFDDWDDKCLKARQLDEETERLSPGKINSARTWVPLEEKLVYDATLAAESPGFPADLRRQVHEVVLRHAIEMRPVNAPDNPRIECYWDIYRELGSMSNKLHTIFHELVVRNLDGFSDSPMAPMRVLYARGEEFREQLAEEARKAGS